MKSKKEKMGNNRIGKKVLATLPALLAGLGLLLGAWPWIQENIYQNYFLGAATCLLYLAWILANFNKKEELTVQGRWGDQSKAMIAMTACVALGLGMLFYYESQMPKYQVASTDKILYKVPPQLSKKQLKELGAECNTYGDTLCSHAVFAKIVKVDPRDFVALANLAMAQSHLGFHKNAIVNFEKAIEKGVKRYDVYKSYGDSLLADKQKAKAIKAYSASLVKNPYQEGLRNKVKKLTQ